MKQKIYFSILFAAIIIIISGKTFAQGVGNHLTISLENCSQPAANIYQFDLDIVSDGVAGSDLRLNSVDFGINFDECILQSGATVSPSYIANSSYFVSPNGPLNGFGFATSTFPNHVRILQPDYSGGNTTQTQMVLGMKYLLGTFQLISSANFTNYCPNFTLQDSFVVGKSVTAAVVWIGNSSSITAFDTSGTGDGKRTLTVTCTCTSNMCITGIIETANPPISFFPNPATNSLTVLLPENTPMAQLKIINLLGEVKYSATVNERKTTIDVSSFSNGVYILEATVGNTVGWYKFVKM